jgi:uncharacterized membrane-anchored protein
VTQSAGYSFLTILSTVVTIYSICEILKATRQLSTTNNNVHVKKRVMVMHACLLIIQNVVAFCGVIPFSVYPRISTIVNTVLPIVDMIV